jgi:hypothetical protein
MNCFVPVIIDAINFEDHFISTISPDDFFIKVLDIGG